MKAKLALVLALVAAVALPVWASSRQADTTQLVQALNGSPTFVGTIVATTSKTNASTAVPFTLTGGSLLLVQCDAAAYFRVASSATTANGVKLAADEKFYVLLKTSQTTVAALAVTGTSNCAVHTVE